jgi:predicted RNA-binding protein with PIN domain
MPYLIDGHNLIPKLPGLSLSEIDDELILVGWLQVFCQKKHRAVEVFFDGALPGFPQKRKFGMVTAYFIRQGSTADAAIQSRLLQAGKSARNLSVVSSDHQVQASAHYAHATVIPAEDFARELVDATGDEPASAGTGKALSEDEIAYWEKIFKDPGRNQA